MRFTIRNKITGMSITLGILVGVISSVISYQLTRNYLIDLSKSNAMQIADIAASEIDGAKHQSLSVGDEETDAYQEILNSISNVLEHSDLEYIYTMALSEDGTFAFVVDADQEEGATIGEEYELLDDIKPALFNGELSCDREATTDEWGSYYSAYAPIYDGNNIVGIVGCDVSTAYIEERLHTLRLIMIVMGICSALLCGLGGFFISLSISKNLKRLKEKVADITGKSGNLSEAITVKSNDELSDIANEMNIFIAQIRDIVVSIKAVSDEIEQNGGLVEDNATIVTNQITEISSSMETLSASMEEYTASTEVSNTSMLETKESVEHIAQKVQEYYSETEKLTRESAELAESTEKERVQIQETITQIEDKMQEAIQEAESVKEIASMADTIIGISNQTKLLALNASIEAARAGEHGKGFSVVAEEINQLSSSSNKAAVEIQKLSETLITTVERLTKSAEDMKDCMDNAVMTDYANFTDALRTNKVNMEGFYRTMQYFDDQINHVKENMEMVSDNIMEISKTVTANTEEITNVNADISSVKDSTEQQKQMARQQAGYVGELSESIGHFRV